jgi:redox-sensitive bicupin YhaK (pirin superfamily)
MAIRTTAKILDAVETTEGGGFKIRRPFPLPGFSEFDPFLLLDEMGPVTYGPGEAIGAPDHPHRGFETVTYVLEGAMEHRDSAGHAGRIGPGDVQWMTAGGGVVLSEMPSADMMKQGGRMHGFQLWVNLPKRDKMMAPRYQEIPSSTLPEGRSADGRARVKVIAGEAFGVKAAIETRTPLVYLQYTLETGATVVQPMGRSFNSFAYLVGGKGRFGADGQEARRGQAVIFAKDGDEVTFTATEPTELLLLGGVPLNEPVVRYGPFVMNTKSEIVKAFEDYQSGRMGAIKP